MGNPQGDCLVPEKQEKQSSLYKNSGLPAQIYQISDKETKISTHLQTTAMNVNRRKKNITIILSLPWELPLTRKPQIA